MSEQPAASFRTRLREIGERLTGGTKKQSFGLNGLDAKLRDFVKLRRGFFIEAGANDGIRQSNTLYFERYYGWTGLLIEPIPQLAEACRKNRPACWVENCALVPFGYSSQQIEMRYCNLMSLVKGAMGSDIADLDHVKRGSAIQNIEPFELTVPARTLTDVLDQYPIERIDLFSLDVEGYELSVLKGLDFERYRPTYLLVEVRNRKEIEDYVAQWYECVAELSFHDVLYRARKV